MRVLFAFVALSIAAYGFLWMVIEVSAHFGIPIIKDVGPLGHLILVSLSLNLAFLLIWLRQGGRATTPSDVGETNASVSPSVVDENALPNFEQVFLDYVEQDTRLIQSPFLSSIRSINLNLIDLFVRPDATVSVGPDTLTEPSESFDRETFWIRALLSQGHALVVGEPGSGKSTLLQYIAHVCCLGGEARRRILGTDTRFVPILLRCTRLAELGSLSGPIEQTLRDAVENAQVKARYVEGFFQNALDEERALLLLDGLDEVTQHEQRLRLVGWLDDIITAYPAAYVFVGTRPDAIRGTPVRRITSEVNLTALDTERSFELIDRLWEVLPFAPTATARRHLLELIERDAHFARMAKSPLLLSLLVLLAATDRLGHAASVSSEMITHLLRRDEQRDIDWPSGPIDPNKLRHTLGRLALRMQEAGHPVLARNLASSELEEDFGACEGHDLLATVATRTGLMRISEATAEFTHSLFRSYLAAEFLSTEYPQLPARIVAKWKDSYWRDVLLFLSELGRSAEVVTRLEAFDDDLLCRRLLLQGECLARSTKALSDIEARVLAALLKCAFEAQFPALRERAKTTLAGFDLTRVGAVVDAAYNQEEQSARTAVDILRRMRGASVRQALLDLYAGGPHTSHLPFVIRGLGHYNDLEVDAILLHLLRDSPAPDLRYHAAEALGGSQRDDVAEHLLERLRTDTDADVRRSAARSLRQLADSRTATDIVQLVLNESDAAVRARLARVMKRYPDQYTNHLIRALRESREEDARWRAAEALGQFATAESQDALMDGLKDSSEAVRGECARALRTCPGGPPISMLCRTAQSDDSDEVRAIAVDSLGFVGGDSAVLTLRAIAFDHAIDRRVRCAALQSLGRLGDLRCVDELVALLADQTETEELREGAAKAIAQLRSRRCAAALLTALESDPSPNVRARCALGLRAPRSSVALTALVKACKTDQHFTVRAWAVEALRATDKPEAWQAISFSAVSDVNDLVRWRAIESLRLRSDPSTASLLTRIISDDHQPLDLRRVAIQSAAYTHDASAVAALMTMLDNEALKDAAYEALGRLIDSPFLDVPRTQHAEPKIPIELY